MGSITHCENGDFEALDVGKLFGGDSGPWPSTSCGGGFLDRAAGARGRSNWCALAGCLDLRAAGDAASAARLALARVR